MLSSRLNLSAPCALQPLLQLRIFWGTGIFGLASWWALMDLTWHSLHHVFHTFCPRWDSVTLPPPYALSWPPTTLFPGQLLVSPWRPVIVRSMSKMQRQCRAHFEVDWVWLKAASIPKAWATYRKPPSKYPVRFSALKEWFAPAEGIPEPLDSQRSQVKVGPFLRASNVYAPTMKLPGNL